MPIRSIRQPLIDLPAPPPVYPVPEARPEAATVDRQVIRRRLRLMAYLTAYAGTARHLSVICQATGLPPSPVRDALDALTADGWCQRVGVWRWIRYDHQEAPHA